MHGAAQRHGRHCCHSSARAVCRASQIYDFSSPAKCKEFLVAQGVEHNENDPLTTLQAYARRRERRLEREGMAPGARRALFDDNLMGVKSIKDFINEKLSEGDATHWRHMKAIIEEISFDVVKLKHHVGNDASCRGNVVDGVCRHCHAQNVVGEYGYAFDMIVVDIKDRTCKMTLKGSMSAGEGLFGITPKAFTKLSKTKHFDALEKVEQMPWYFGIQVKVTGGGTDVLKIGHSFVKLPLSELDARE